MNLWNNKKIILLITILAVFSIGYFIIMNKVSYAFTTSSNIEDLYNLTIETIKTSSIEYANKNLDMFNESNTLVIKVQDLIDNNLLIPNEDGNIINPLESPKTLNSRIITINYDNNKFEVNVEN